MPSDVPEFDRQVFELTNKLRGDPSSFIPILQIHRSYPYNVIFRKEPVDENINEAIEYLGCAEPVSLLRWNAELSKAAGDYLVSNGYTLDEILERYGKVVGKYGINYSFVG